ncbi:MAG: DUF6268 family outer membrane beta-barrel protein [bacterium]
MTGHWCTACSFILILVVAINLFPADCRADGFQLASFSFERVPSAEIDLTGVEEEELETAASTTTTKLAVPIPLAGRETVLLNFITLRVLHQSYGNIEAADVAFLPSNLYTIKYGLVFHQTLSDQWSLNVLVQPSLLTDFVDVDSDHLILRGGFVFERKVSDKLKYALGGGYSDDYGDEKILPVAWLKWKPCPNWHVNFDIPQKIEVLRRVSERVQLGLVGKATGAHFRIGQDTPFRNGSDHRVGRVKYSIVNIGPALDWRIYNGVCLTLNGGTSVYRRYEVFDTDGDKLAATDFESSIFLKATVQYSIGD